MPLPLSPLRVKIVYLLGIVSLLLAACSASSTESVPPEAVQSPSALDPLDEPAPTPSSGDGGGLVFLSIEENAYAHLFVFDPAGSTLTRITAGDWNDIAPALSPDRARLAFASDRGGSWDLYVMALTTGELKQVTDTPNYDSAPSWSPDGQWLAFETYQNENLEIAVVNVDSGEQVPLTQHPASDHTPAWAPDGRHVAFVSSRGGDSDIWLANLDLAGDERYQNLSNTPFASESSPVWNYDGSQLLWADRLARRSVSAACTSGMRLPPTVRRIGSATASSARGTKPRTRSWR
ncbi:MAG: TolB family protein [Chloroflexi bacterium]|nr:TolB family protein [Chloroflexota bacterium]